MAKFASVDEYIQAQPEPQARLLRELRTAILEAVPGATEAFNYGVPAFALVQNGKQEQQILIGSFKNHVGIYPHPTTIAQFEKELSRYKQGKGFIQFPLDQPIPHALIVKMVRFRKGEIDREA